MPDTGAPWNIPYVAPTDNPRVFPAADEAQALAIAAGLSGAASAGIGTNVVQTVKTDTFSIASSTFTDVTGLNVSITPTTNTSKVLVMVYVFVAGDPGIAPIQARLLRGSTVIFESAGGSVKSFAAYEQAGERAGGYTPVFLDSPGVNTSVNYKVQVRIATGTGYVGRTAGNQTHSATSITAIEVAA
jgi:hypothetical protein